MQLPTEQSKAPAVDDDLRWLFHWAGADLGFASTTGSTITRAERGNGQVYSSGGDDRLINRGLVTGCGAKDHKHSAAARLRTLLPAYYGLPVVDQNVLWLAYGERPLCLHAPNDRKETKRGVSLHSRAGRFSAVLCVTSTVRAAYNQTNPKRRVRHADGGWRNEPVGVREWLEGLVMQAKPGAPVVHLLSDARVEAEQMVWMAWLAWSTARGANGNTPRVKRRRIAVYHRAEEPKPWA